MTTQEAIMTRKAQPENQPASNPENPFAAALDTPPGDPLTAPLTCPDETSKDDPPCERPRPKNRRFRVIKGGNISTGGVRATLREGKELDERNYDIRNLVRQGIRLEEITDEDTADPLTT